jgi:hypothetical protein
MHTRRNKPQRATSIRLLAALATLAVSAVAISQPAAASPAGPSTPPARPSAVTDPDAALGTGWRQSSDILVTGAGDSKGFHLYVAREKDAFAWSTLATLTSSALDLGPWTGEVCVTGSGRYAVAVYAPAVAANKPKLLQAGGLAAVVDIRTGKATAVASGVELAYFNPSCGAGDRALLTRSIGADEEQTDLLTVDAAAGRVTSKRRIKAQLTTPAPAPDGDYGIVHGSLVKIVPSGDYRTVAHPKGRPFAVHATAHNGIDVASVDGTQAVVQRFAHGSVTALGTGQAGRLQLLSLTGGRSAVVGDTAHVNGRVPELSTLSSDKRVQAASAQGHLLVQQLLTSQTAHTVSAPLARSNPADAGSIQITERATHSGRAASATIATTDAPTLNTTPRPAGPGTAFRSDAVTANDISTPSCAIGRNDPHVQPLQPSPDMVEWSIDQAVHNSLTVQRPNNYLKNGQYAYTPQGLFKPHAIAGGGPVPAQVMLGIVAQETNMSQASWHAVPGDLGNPLIADYYGNGNADINSIDYGSSDCGYGIGQVTDGMHAADTSFNHPQQVAIATDYAANIAAAMNILIDKWNQLYTEPDSRIYVNDGDSRYVENWYLAIWAYNSGYHPQSLAGSNNGHYGVGWLNNPANPRYPADRHPFLRDTYDDAAHPGRWPYQEKVLGWIETPQLKGTPSSDAYAKPNFGGSTGGQLSLPAFRVFCSPGINSCDPTASGDPCPAESDACWWHGHVTYINDCTRFCATENLSYGVGTSEPGVKRVYDRDCENFTGFTDAYRDVTRQVRVVYDLNDTSQYALGCSTSDTGGKFTLRLGSPAGGDGSTYGQIDLHQLGAGYNGHMWFTHVFPPSEYGAVTYNYHKVVGTWTPELNLSQNVTQRYDVLVHLPSHGGEYSQAEYLVYPDTSDAIANPDNTCVIDQGTGSVVTNGSDKWVYIGNYTLARGARVQLSNIGDYTANGTTDIAFDAMAFVPIVNSPGHNCKDSY